VLSQCICLCFATDNPHGGAVLLQLHLYCCMCVFYGHSTIVVHNSTIEPADVASKQHSTEQSHYDTV
jgi:hypothetical protein